MKSKFPIWYLQELVDDLQDAAVDLGIAYGSGKPEEAAEANYNAASDRLAVVLRLSEEEE